jgi:hypothetical protein
MVMPDSLQVPSHCGSATIARPTLAIDAPACGLDSAARGTRTLT